LKHFPNIAIYDFARGLATHTNLREPEILPFRPHEGRLAEATTDNLQLAGEGKLKVSLPWLKTKKTETDANCHPITGTSDHYTMRGIQRMLETPFGGLNLSQNWLAGLTASVQSNCFQT